jgi:hypothetical protein
MVNDDRRRATRISEGKCPYRSFSGEETEVEMAVCIVIQTNDTNVSSEDEQKMMGSRSNNGALISCGRSGPVVKLPGLRRCGCAPFNIISPLFITVLVLTVLPHCNTMVPEHYEIQHMVPLQSARGAFQYIRGSDEGQFGKDSFNCWYRFWPSFPLAHPRFQAGSVCCCDRCKTDESGWVERCSYVLSCLLRPSGVLLKILGVTCYQ